MKGQKKKNFKYKDSIMKDILKTKTFTKKMEMRKQSMIITKSIKIKE